MIVHQPFALSPFSCRDSPLFFRGLRFNGGFFVHPWRARNHGKVSCTSDGGNFTTKLEKKRKVVEHVCVLKAKGNLSDEEEKDMLDYLYTSQYQMRGIVAISLGCLGNPNEGNYTHAFYMRFQRNEDLGKFYENPSYLKVLNEHVTPYCHGLINIDYESEVEDDILPIFRRGEEFNYGEEFVLLVSFSENASGEYVRDAMDSFENLTSSLPSLIVQSTQGSNFNSSSSKEFTHAAVVRFRSFDAFEMFIKGAEYNNMWKSKFEPIIQKQLALHFSVDPIGTDIM